MTTDREYGARGRIGIGVPQANSTVEPELRQLLPAGVEFYAVRLFAPEPDEPRRIASYLERIEEYLARYDGLALDAFGFAITGSTYLLGHSVAQALVAAAEQRFGISVVTTANALVEDLRALGAQRIQLVSPYPAYLTDAARSYWDSMGFEVVRIVNVGSPTKRTNEIYSLSSQDAIAALEREPGNDVDAIVCSGTGLPTLGLLAARERITRTPLVTSTHCLTNALLARLGLPRLEHA